METGNHNPVIIGESPLIDIIRKDILVVGASDINIVITGETGTGKELVARNLHSASKRKDGPFVAINCAGISESLLESELFGYVPGSFTGGRREGSRGLLEQAHRGTLFLDEVGLMTEKVQMALLRALQHREVKKVGGDSLVKTDFRLLTATNIDLEAAVDQGRFREDLFHRIYEDSFHIPPLRDRKEDIPILVKHFTEMYCTKAGRRPLSYDKLAIESLKTYDWPGNVRELENLVKRIVTRVKDQYVSDRDIQALLVRRESDRIADVAAGGGLVPQKATKEDIYALAVRYGIKVGEFEEGMVRAALRQYPDKMTAARVLGMSKSSFYRRAKELESNPGNGDSASP